MNSSISLRKIQAGYAVAGITLCFGFFLSARLASHQFQSTDVSALFRQLFYFLALAIVLNFTCAWGWLRGFPLRENGRVKISHLLRILVMTAIVWAAVCFLCAPFILFFFRA